jgi:beta-glucosidase
VSDDQAAGGTEVRDRKRAEAYAPWFEFARDDDFIGVQNYNRSRYDANGEMPPSADAARNYLGTEVYGPSLAGAVRYVFDATRKPIVVTEHGVGTDDDALRARFIPEALQGLHQAIADGVPVWGYIHWALLDNFEWYGGFAPKFGLASVEPKTFARIPKPSARALGRIARDNAL